MANEGQQGTADTGLAEDHKPVGVQWETDPVLPGYKPWQADQVYKMDFEQTELGLFVSHDPCKMYSPHSLHCNDNDTHPS